MNRGEVYLVGAGPGDPELLTVKAYRLICEADVLVYDRLVGPGIVDLCKPDCRKIYVGKRKHLHLYSQAQINELLIREARAERCVVRLKGGDPFIFGRGGEELEQLRNAGVPCTVVPGITSAAGAAAAIGLPLTLRDHASAVTFATAHRKDGRLKVDWALITRPEQHVAIYMGMSVLEELVEGLTERSVPAHTRITIVSRATRSDQQVLHSQLDRVVDECAIAQISTPAMIFLHQMPRHFTIDGPADSVHAFAENENPHPVVLADG